MLGGGPLGGGSSVAYLVVLFADINKTSFLHTLLLQSILHNGKRPSKFLPNVSEDLTPLAHSTILRDSAIVTSMVNPSFDAFDIATWLKTLVSLLEQLCPVSNTAN